MFCPSLHCGCNSGKVNDTDYWEAKQINPSSGHTPDKFNLSVHAISALQHFQLCIFSFLTAAAHTPTGTGRATQKACQRVITSFSPSILYCLKELVNNPEVFSLFFDSFLLSPPFTSLYQTFHPYQKWDIGVSLTTVFQKKSQNRRFMILYFADMSGG